MGYIEGMCYMKGIGYMEGEGEGEGGMLTDEGGEGKQEEEDVWGEDQGGAAGGGPEPGSFLIVSSIFHLFSIVSDSHPIDSARVFASHAIHLPLTHLLIHTLTYPPCYPTDPSVVDMRVAPYLRPLLTRVYMVYLTYFSSIVHSYSSAYGLPPHSIHHPPPLGREGGNSGGSSRGHPRPRLVRGADTG